MRGRGETAASARICAGVPWAQQKLRPPSISSPLQVPSYSLPLGWSRDINILAHQKILVNPVVNFALMRSINLIKLAQNLLQGNHQKYKRARINPRLLWWQQSGCCKQGRSLLLGMELEQPRFRLDGAQQNPRRRLHEILLRGLFRTRRS